jgi:8-oxo-dGTP pyrophosphatase MutT (NUDIX family)
MLKIHLAGCWSRSQVTVHRTPSARRIVPQVESAIDTAWASALSRPGVHLFDGPQCRLESWTADATRLQLALSPSTYKIFLGTNMANPQFTAQFGPEVMANPLGVSPALMTADHHLLLGCRSAAVAYHPNRVHPFAGCMEPDDADPFETVLRELKEELSIAPEEITQLHCIGLAEDLQLHQPELVFSAITNQTKSQIQSRLDLLEHRSIWSIPAETDAVETAVSLDNRLTPIAAASLLLWGRLNAGQDWFDRAGTRIR